MFGGDRADGGELRERIPWPQLQVHRVRLVDTATALINELRLTRAAAELKMTDLPIVRIAAECGIANLSHFYRLFNARFGVTPRRYRLGQQTLIHGSGVERGARRSTSA